MIFNKFEQINWAKLLLINEFKYNNTKNASPYQIHLEFNSGYKLYKFFKNNIYNDVGLSHVPRSRVIYFPNHHMIKQITAITW